MKSAKADVATGHYVVIVREERAILPADLKKAIGDLGYAFLGAAIEAAGTVEKSGEGWVFVARGSGQKYDLKPTEEFLKLAGEGKTKLTIRGEVWEQGEKDGVLPPPLIEVTGAEELKEEGK